MSRRKLRAKRHLEEEEEEEEEDEQEEQEDQIREGQEEEGGIAPQPENGYGDEYGQEIEVPQDGNLEGQEDMHLDLSQTKRKRVQLGAIPDQVAKKRRSHISPSYPVRSKGKEIAYESDRGSDGDYEMANTYSLFLHNHFLSQHY